MSDRKSSLPEIFEDLTKDTIKDAIKETLEAPSAMVKSASDLQEANQLIKSTFGKCADAADAFCKSANRAYGLSAEQAADYMGAMGAILKGMGWTQAEALDMSTSLVGLTGDMASFYNLDHETAFEKIRSGISGETEPLKQLGINMSVANLEAYALTKGIKKAYDEMSEAEKVQLRYGYIMEQTTDAQGDFVRTQDSYANQVRVLQNNLDTMAANVGSMLIPALTKATGWMNSLFAEPDTTETQAAISAAIESLDGLETDIASIKRNYTRDAIKIQIDYESAGELLADYETLKNVGVESAGISEKMKEIAAQLLALYPQLEPYIDSETGLLATETTQVHGLIEGYRDLAIYKLMASKVESIGGEYLEAVVDMKLLEEELKNAQGELDALNEKAALYNRISQAFTGNYAVGAKRDVQAELDLINEYITAYGNLDDILKLASENNVDLDALFGADGVLRSAEEISKLEGGLEALTGLFNALYSTAAAENRQTGEGILAAEQSVESAQNAIKEFEPVLNEALAEYETALGALNTYAEEVGIDIGNALGEDAAASLRAQSGEVKDAAEDVIDIAQAAANKKPIRLSFAMSAIDMLTRYVLPGHATGLDRVPYDNYLARLHVGEAVLTASEAQKWRAGESKGGGVSAEQLAAAMEPVVESIRNIRIALDVDGREFASNQAAHNRTALNRYNTQIARGMGK